MRTITVSVPLVPLRVGDVVDRRAWVPHITLMGNMRIPDGGTDTASAVLRAVARAVPAPRVVVGAEALFGPDRTILVDLVDAPELESAHRVLLDALEQHVEGLQILQPTHTRSGYRSHRTVVSGPRPSRGDVLTPTTAMLVELDREGSPGTAVVLARFELGGPDPEGVVTEAAVHAVLDAFLAARVRAWVIGGWGVDALAGERSRVHHDIDLFVDANRTAESIDALASVGFVVRSVWSENRWTERDGRLLPSAFVAIDPEGREVDVHTVRIHDGDVTSVSASTIVLPPGALGATGTISGRPVPCATAEAQLVMHTGYPLPERQRTDVEFLRRLVTP